MKPVILHADAQEELGDAIAFYEDRRRGLGLDLAEEVEAAIELIEGNPEIGAPYKDEGFRHYTLRRFPFVLYYLELEEVVWVFAVAHGRRRPNYWRHRRVY